MRFLATLALAVAGLAGLFAFTRAPPPATWVALAAALPVAAATLRDVRRRDPHEFDVVVAIAGTIAAVAYGGMALNGARWNAAALAVAALAALAAAGALVEVWLLGRRGAAEPDPLRDAFPPAALVETEGVQWAVRPPGPAAGHARPVEVALGLQNAWDAARGVTVRLDLPRGFAAPGPLTVALGPLESGILHVPLAGAPGARRGKARVRLAVAGGGGRRVRHRRHRDIPGAPTAAARAFTVLLALRNPFEVLLALAEPAIRFPLEPPAGGGGAPPPAGPPPLLNARWERLAGAADPGAARPATRAQEAAARFRRAR